MATYLLLAVDAHEAFGAVRIRTTIGVAAETHFVDAAVLLALLDAVAEKPQRAPEDVVAVLGAAQLLRDDFVATDVLPACTAKQTFRRCHRNPSVVLLLNFIPRSKCVNFRVYLRRIEVVNSIMGLFAQHFF